MQIAEIILLNSNSTIYARCNNEKNDKVVVIVNGCLELGAVKKFIPEYNAELCDVIRTANQDDFKKNCENCKFCKSLLPEIKKEVENQGLDFKISSITYFSFFYLPMTSE